MNRIREIVDHTIKRHPQLSVLAVAGAGALTLPGCFSEGDPYYRSWENLVESNGFSAPIENVTPEGSGSLVLRVGYGACRIDLETNDPWYEDYTVTYLPRNTALEPIEAANAAVLDEAPPEYGLKDCVIKR